MIKKTTEKGKTVYKVLSMKGREMGTYSKEEDAQKRLRQIEFFQRVKDGKIKLPKKQMGKAFKRLSKAKKR